MVQKCQPGYEKPNEIHFSLMYIFSRFHSQYMFLLAREDVNMTMMCDDSYFRSQELFNQIFPLETRSVAHKLAMKAALCSINGLNLTRLVAEMSEMTRELFL